MEIAIMLEGQNGLNWPRFQRIASAVEDLGFFVRTILLTPSLPTLIRWNCGSRSHGWQATRSALSLARW